MPTKTPGNVRMDAAVAVAPVGSEQSVSLAPNADEPINWVEIGVTIGVTCLLMIAALVLG